jgi:hypothetical protein
MNSFKKTKTAKAVSTVVGFATALMMMGPSVASAQTVEDLTAQINSLLSTIAALQSQLATLSGGSTTTTGGACYTFATNMKMGDSNADVLNLQKKLNESADTQ